MDIPMILDFYTLFTSLLCASSIFGYGLYFYKSSYNPRDGRMNNLFMSSIFFSDQFVIIGHAFPSIVAAKMQNWPFGDVGCQWHAFAGIMACITSTGSTVAFALNYCYSDKLKGTPSWFLVSSVWLFGCVCGYLPTFVFDNYAFESELKITCGVDYRNVSDVYETCFIIFMMLFVIFAPAVIIYLCFRKSCSEDEIKYRNTLMAQSIICTFPYMLFGMYVLAQHGNTSNATLAVFNVVSVIFFKLKSATNPFINLNMIPRSQELKYSMLSLFPDKKKSIPKCTGNMYAMRM